ncbi:MAG: 1-(5-phosphoribosyl)-5-[(5-phosphoribosylamino)methylideneamino]imidazole-4-carboxamide isomerase [Candidatus Omnitrophota bacterium]|nr:1-(5-phosphoribosyl)-5-[(5-phosphoribosylamino)methylideneamino]imidazole-4-carboxamide isomerase [Candidatus Omnitrophota bacterium]
MIIIPAIDIKDGAVVRLLQGKFNEATIYSRKPEEVAHKWEAQGAKIIHVVDLDGAKAGKVVNYALFEKIIKAVKIPIQVGGGIRYKEDIQRLMASGVKKVVVGTKAVEDKSFIQDIISRWPDNILVSIDASSGRVAEKGWQAVTTKKTEDLAQEMQEIGVKQLVFTDISRDGTLIGPNIPEIKKLLSMISIPLLVAGGISNLQDILKLKALERDGLTGVIVGKALYEGTLDLIEALKIC